VQEGIEPEAEAIEGESGSTVTSFRPAPEPEDKTPALSAILLAELEAHRTAGLQAALAWQPELALQVMVHALATDALHSRYGETILALHTYPPALAAACPGIADSPARQPYARPKTHSARACPASMAHSGDGCRTRTCRPC
jgi:ParB family chromosome partitioning protein